MLLRDVFDEYTARKTNLRESSREQIECSVTAIERWAGRMLSIEELTEGFLSRWIASRRKTAAPSTAQRNLSNVTCLLRFAARKLGSGLTVPDVDPVAVPRPIPVAWTVQQVGSILAVCHGLKGQMRALPISRADWWTALILFLYDSGSRIHAALEVSPQDFDFGTRTVVLRHEHSKTGDEQIVDVGPDTADAIQRVIDSA